MEGFFFTIWKKKTMQNSSFKFDLNFKTKIKEAIPESKGHRVIVHE